MRRWNSVIQIIAIFLCLVTAAYAQEDNSQNGVVEQANQFDVEQANKRFDQISIKLSTVNLNVNELNRAIEVLSDYEKRAEECIESVDKKIAEVDNKISLYFGEGEDGTTRVDSKYLKNQKDELLQRQSQCRLFKIRASDAIEAYRKTALSLQKKITFTQGKLFTERLNLLPEDIEKLSLPKLKVTLLSHFGRYWAYYLVALGFSFWFSYRLRFLLHKKWRRKKGYLLVNTMLIFLMMVLTAYYFMTNHYFDEETDNVFFNDVLLQSVFFCAILFLFNFFFALRRIPRLLRWYGVDLVFLKRLGNAIIIVYFLRHIGLNFMALNDASTNMTLLYEDIILLIALSLMIYFTWILYHVHSQWFNYHFSGNLIVKLTSFIVMTLVILDYIGYYLLAVDAAYVIFSFLLVSALGTVLFLAIHNVYNLLSYHKYYSKVLRKYFGYSNEPPFIDLLVLKLIFQLIVILGSCYLFAYLIGEASYFLDKLLDHLVYGIQIANFKIIPLQWLIGVMVFCLLTLFSRYVARKISIGHQFNDSEEETQVAIASIIMYVGIALSVIIGLLIAGFSFTSLTIIAGALSVGIGLGLQSIVNNFFSGLILLIEKPIKAGDRIKIDNIEGFVKKVRVRSTQLMTPSQEDIIIPNSDLITHQVTNYMFSDKFWRVKCEVGVAYGSDTDVVKEVLKNVALSHPEVVKTIANRPMVLFRRFGDSALMFEVWCLIKDVNKKYVVTSELNFAIDKACRENNITIAFPQRDVHIKFDNDKLPWKNSDDEDKDKK